MQGRQVFAAPGLVSDSAGVSGGVAIVDSTEYTDAHATTLVPGCVLMVEATLRGQAVRFVSVYLPPTNREGTLAMLRDNPPPDDDVPTYWAGDVNMQIPCLRSERRKTSPPGWESTHDAGQLR